MIHIYDPITHKRHSLLSEKGIYILKQYIKTYQLGGSTIAERVKHRRNLNLKTVKKQQSGKTQIEEAQTHIEEGEAQTQIEEGEAQTPIEKGEAQTQIGKNNSEFFNNPEKEYSKTQSKKDIKRKLREKYKKYITYTKNPEKCNDSVLKKELKGTKLEFPTKLYRALRPRDLYWLFRTGNLEAPCIGCDHELMYRQECCKVSAPYHIQQGSNKTVLKGPWLSMTLNKNTAALWSGRDKNDEDFTFNVDPVLEANWDIIDDEKIPTNGRSGIFVEINTQDLPIINTIFLKRILGNTAYNNAKSAEEYLIENRIPGTHITKIFISNDTNDESELQKYIDNQNPDNLGGIQKYRYKKDENMGYEPPMVIYKDDLSDSVGINYVEKKDELITMKQLFELCNKDKRFVKGQPWYEQQIAPLLEETDSIP